MSVAGLLVTVAAVAVGLGFLWRFGALAAVAWFLVATMALSLVADIEVPTSAVVLAVLCWAASCSLGSAAGTGAAPWRGRWPGAWSHSSTSLATT